MRAQRAAEKGRSPSPESDASGEDEASENTEESDDADIPKNPAGDEYKSKRTSLRSRLRECRLMLHRIKFLLGDVYHILGEAHAQDEASAYEVADNIRKGLLEGDSIHIILSKSMSHQIPVVVNEKSASRAMVELSKDAKTQGLSERALKIKLPFLPQGGIRSHELVRFHYHPSQETCHDSCRCR